MSWSWSSPSAWCCQSTRKVPESPFAERFRTLKSTMFPGSVVAPFLSMLAGVTKTYLRGSDPGTGMRMDAEPPDIVTAYCRTFNTLALASAGTVRSERMRFTCA